MLSALEFIFLPSFKNNNEINKCFEEGHTSNKHEIQEPYLFLSTYKALLLEPLGTIPGPAALTENTLQHTEQVLLQGLGFPAII